MLVLAATEVFAPSSSEIAPEIGIDPTCRQAADLGLIPIVIKDACGAGHAEAAEKSLSNLAFIGDTIVRTDKICELLSKRRTDENPGF